MGVCCCRHSIVTVTRVVWRWSIWYCFLWTGIYMTGHAPLRKLHSSRRVGHRTGRVREWICNWQKGCGRWGLNGRRVIMIGRRMLHQRGVARFLHHWGVARLLHHGGVTSRQVVRAVRELQISHNCSHRVYRIVRLMMYHNWRRLLVHRGSIKLLLFTLLYTVYN